MDVLIQHPVNSEVFAEMAELETRLSKLMLPVGIILERVDQNRPLLSTVTNQVSLTVAL